MLASEVAKRVDAITANLNSWVRTLGPAANDCSKLALLRGTGRAAGAGEGLAGDVDVIVLLVLSRFQPVMQVFSRCALVGVPVARTFVCPPTPFQVEGIVSPSRLCSAVLEFCTSDELALELAKLRDAWSLMPLVWREPLGAPSLLHLEVVGAEDPFVARAVASVPRVAGVADLLQTLDILSGAPAVAAMPPQMMGDGPDEDAILAGMPADFAQDIVEEMEEVSGVGPDADEDVAAALATSAAAAAAVAVDEADSDAGTEVAFVEAAAAAEVEAAMPWVALAESAVVDEEGYVTHPSEPWSLLWKGRVGRITTWPKEQPLHARNVSCKCMYHTSDCSSKAIGRSQNYGQAASMLAFRRGVRAWLHIGPQPSSREGAPGFVQAGGCCRGNPRSGRGVSSDRGSADHRLQSSLKRAHVRNLTPSAGRLVGLSLSLLSVPWCSRFGRGPATHLRSFPPPSLRFRRGGGLLGAGVGARFV